MEIKKLILPLFLAGIMIFSVIGFALTYSQDDSSKVEYNGHKFQQIDQGWVTYVEDQPILISQNPQYLSSVDLPEVSLALLNSANKIYFTFNPTENLQNSLAYFDINVRPRIKSFVISCIEDSEPCANLPLKTCEDAELYEKIIQVNLANESSIAYKNNCLHIQGSKEEMPTIMDALILKLLL